VSGGTKVVLRASYSFGTDTSNLSYEVASSRIHAYIYDAKGKMTSATLVSPTTETVSLTYDGDGNLVQKAANGVTTSYLIDTNNLSGYAQIVEAKTNGALTDVFNYGSTGIVSQGHVPTGTTVYFGKDGSNNTRYLTDSQTGNVTDTFDYTADGIRVNGTGSFPAAHQFQGEYLDPDLNLYDLRARWLNPQTGEFMTMDTYEGQGEDPASLHKYAFVQWDGGINDSDPTGQQLEDAEGLGMVIAAGIAGMIAAIPHENFISLQRESPAGPLVLRHYTTAIGYAGIMISNTIEPGAKGYSFWTDSTFENGRDAIQGLSLYRVRDAGHLITDEFTVTLDRVKDGVSAPIPSLFLFGLGGPRICFEYHVLLPVSLSTHVWSHRSIPPNPPMNFLW